MLPKIHVAITSTSNTVAVTTTQYVWTPSWWFYLLLSAALAAVFVAVTAGAAVLVFIIAKRGGRIAPNFGLSENTSEDSVEYAINNRNYSITDVWLQLSGRAL